jgi:sodium-dependent dicarboxylate transporter 2/3/5
LLFVILLWLPVPGDMPPTAFRVMAVTVLMAIWWITEAIPIASTALLPIALFPMLGVMSTADATVSYANHLIYLFLGGFLIAVTMEKWNLHKRIALYTISIVGVSPRRMILGFMLATAMLSMWISNTATAMMMLPIGMAVIGQVSLMRGMGQSEPSETERHFGIALMLGIAYSASIGGVATLIGTPPNAILAGMAEELYGLKISFAGWMSFGLPLSLIMLLIAWLYLTRIAFRCDSDVVPGARQLIRRELSDLGRISKEERWVLVIFASVALAWIARGFISLPALKMVSDSSIAIVGALLLFLIPSNFRKGEFLLDWKTAKGIPWDIIILFGGGFALAKGFSDSGLTAWIAIQLKAMEGMTLILVIAAVTLVVILLTEVTSNTATATLVIPLMGAMAEAIGVNVYSLMVPAAVAASYAFMLPVATPPNAIVFSSRYVSIPQMARAGLWLNLVAVVLITLFVFLVLPLVWGVDLESGVL